MNLSYSASVLPEAPTQLGGRAERLYHIAVMRAQKGAYEVKGKGYYKYPTSYEEAANNEAIYDAFWDRGLGLEAKNIIQDSLNPFSIIPRTGTSISFARERFLMPISKRVAVRRG